MIQFRCRTHRDPIQKLWQIARSEDGTLAGRPLEGVMKAGLRPGGWVPESRALEPGLYCQACLQDGINDPLPDYDEVDLAEAGLAETPHIGLTASDFDLDAVWASIREHFSGMVVAENDRHSSPAKTDARFRSDERLFPALRDAILTQLNGGDLYSHQATAIDSALSGTDVVIETATASGKSFCYWIPVANALLQQPKATALYISPLNALAEDQLQAIDRIGKSPITHFRPGTFPQYVRSVKVGERSFTIARYEGSITDQEIRRGIRKAEPNVIITNPDMLHYGILPHHKKGWPRFFANLKYIVLDEMHVYRGMFGANCANILRRVLRLARHYGATPQVIGCSASIGNPKELFSALTGRADPVLVSAADNGAPIRRQKRVVLDLARSADAMSTVVKDLLLESIGRNRARTIAFMRSISEVDQVYRYVAGELGRTYKGISKTTVREYKREIPVDQKAQVTADLKNGATLGVVSTTALQLGIDIGDLSVAVVAKFPGSKAAFFQQAGRVGRSGESLVFFIADRSPLDQWFAQRPNELLLATSEVVFVNPHHRETVLSHLRCAAEELPIDPIVDEEYFGDELADLLKELAARGGMSDDGREVLVIRRAGDSAKDVSIRSLGFECIVRDESGDEVAKPDVLRAMRRFHKYARFQIQEQAFEVTRLSINWNERAAEAIARKIDRLDYTTTSVVKTECEVQTTDESMALVDKKLEQGGVRFTVFVDSYYRIPTSGTGSPEYQPLGVAAPPHYELDTHGLWIEFSALAMAGIPTEDREPAVRSAIESLRISAALLCSTDPDDIGTHVEVSPSIDRVFAYLADTEAGGSGLTEQVFKKPIELFEGALRILEECPNCKAKPESRGCPQCVTTPWGGDSDVNRAGGIELLKSVVDDLRR